MRCFHRGFDLLITTKIHIGQLTCLVTSVFDRRGAGRGVLVLCCFSALAIVRFICRSSSLSSDSSCLWSAMSCRRSLFSDLEVTSFVNRDPTERRHGVDRTSTRCVQKWPLALSAHEWRQACRHGGAFRSSASPNFGVLRKICFKHITQTKIFTPKNLFYNLKTWLWAWLTPHVLDWPFFYNIFYNMAWLAVFLQHDLDWPFFYNGCCCIQL